MMVGQERHPAIPYFIMENGKRPSGKEMAKRQGKVLNINRKVFL
jgi:hypothetical protein